MKLTIVESKKTKNIEFQNYIAEEIEYILSKNKMVQRKLDKLNEKLWDELGLNDLNKEDLS